MAYLSYQSRDSQMTTTRNQCQGAKNQTVIDKLLEAQYSQLWELKIPGRPCHRGAPTILEDLFPGAWPFSPLLTSEKNLLQLSTERGEKEPFWNTPNILFLRNPATRGNYLLGLSLLGYYQSLTWLGEKNTQSRHSSHCVPHKWGEKQRQNKHKNRNTCEVHRPEA